MPNVSQLQKPLRIEDGLFKIIYMYSTHRIYSLTSLNSHSSLWIVHNSASFDIFKTEVGRNSHPRRPRWGVPVGISRIDVSLGPDASKHHHPSGHGRENEDSPIDDQLPPSPVHILTCSTPPGPHCMMPNTRNFPSKRTWFLSGRCFLGDPLIFGGLYFPARSGRDWTPQSCEVRKGLKS